MNQRDLIVGLDACRAHSDDLGQPELRDLAQFVSSDPQAARLQTALARFDAATRRAMSNVPLPGGFQARLADRLRQAGGNRETSAQANDSPQDTLAISPVQQPLSRRKWLAWSAGGVAVAAAAATTAIVLLKPATPLGPEDLESARNWHDVVKSSDDWADFSPAEEHSLPRELRVVPRRYLNASKVVGRKAIAYDVSLAGGPRATLFVVPQAERAGVPGFVPLRPQSTTMGQTVSYWQRGDLLYVVVIEGNRPDDYLRLLNTTPAAAA
jgi:hypothetical protein